MASQIAACTELITYFERLFDVDPYGHSWYYFEHSCDHFEATSSGTIADWLAKESESAFSNGHALTCATDELQERMRDVIKELTELLLAEYGCPNDTVVPGPSDEEARLVERLRRL